MKKENKARLAIRWDTSNPRVLSYMIIDADYNYIKEPAKIELPKAEALEDSKKRFDEILKGISDECERVGPPLTVICKTVRKNSKTPPLDISIHIDKCIEKTFKNRKKVNSDLEGKRGLNRFRKIFEELELYPDECKEAYVRHLWAVALKATPKKWDVGLKKVWRVRNGISPSGKLTKDKRKELERFFADHLKT